MDNTSSLNRITQPLIAGPGYSVLSVISAVTKKTGTWLTFVT
jgi:hypothetical protein